MPEVPMEHHMNGKATLSDRADDEFEGLEEAEFEAIVKKALGISAEQAAAIRAEYPE